MSANLLRFLLRDRALAYWSSSKNRWLAADRPAQHFRLTDEGIKKVQDRLRGRASGQSVTREAVLAELQSIRGILRSEPMVSFDFSGLAEEEVPNFENESEAPTPKSGIEEAYDPDRLDTDQRVLASIWTRRGQPEFRARLIQVYGARCAITGCDVVEALEAAHLIPFAEEHGYALSNGVLLRADLHTLFDLFLLSINPDSLTVCIAPHLAVAYGILDGINVYSPDDTSARPDKGRLLRHYGEWRKRWCGG